MQFLESKILYVNIGEISIFMGLTKIGLNLAKKNSAWIKASRKTSILQTNPINSNEFKGLKYNLNLQKDTFAKEVDSWYKKPPAGFSRPYASKGTMVNNHHDFNRYNDFYNSTFEDRIKHLDVLKNKNYNKYQQRILEEKEQFKEETKILLENNIFFTKLIPQPRNCVAYRGVNRRIGVARQDFDVINSANIGDVITPTRGFAYGAHNKLGTYMYLGSPYNIEGKKVFEPMLIEYRIPKGSQISSNMEHGGEVVFPALSKYKLISKDSRLIEELDSQSGKVIGYKPYKHIVLEYIPEIPLSTDIYKFID